MICDECAYNERSYDDLPCCICHFGDKGIPKEDDLISRTKAIQIMMDEDVDHVQGTSDREVIQILMDLPAAQSQRMRGRWKQIIPASVYECSLCGKYLMTSDIDAFKFCHGCGAEMDGGGQDD